jgi:hypothetical protein
VRGVEVFIERESKSAEDLKFRVHVPLMHRHATETARYASTFNVDVRMKWRDNDEQDHVEGQGKESEGRNSEESGSRVLPFNNAPAGSRIAMRLFAMGLKTADRAMLVSKIAHVLGTSDTNVRKQLKGAIEAGFVTRLDDGRYYLTEEGCSVGGKKKVRTKPYARV